MPFSSGSYTLPAGNPVVTATTISSSWANTTMSDIATALSTAVLKDGTQVITANIPMAGFKFTGLGAGSATGNSLRYEQLFSAAAVNLLGPINWVKTTVASATSPDIWTSAGNLIDYTGTVTATSFAAAPQAGAMRILVCAGAAVFTASANMLIQGVASAANFTAAAGDIVRVDAFTTTQFYLTIWRSSGIPSISTQSANIVFAGPSSGAAAAPAFRALVPADLSMTPITNSLGGDVALNNTANYFDGPSVAQGTAGTWFVSGTVVVLDTAGIATYSVKLWDGTTVIASGSQVGVGASSPMSVSLSGYIVSPAGNLRISAKDITSTNGAIKFNSTGNSKDSTITAIRIA